MSEINAVPPEKKRAVSFGRVLDALALLVIVFVAYRIFVAPRLLEAAHAQPAPRVSYPRLDGGTFALAGARGRVVFLDFYASWCTPCRASLPLVESYARAHPEIEVVPVDVGEPRVVSEAFAKRYRLANVALDPSASSSGIFQIEGFPTMVVVDPQGDVRATWQGFNPAVGMAMANAEKALSKRS